MDLYINWSLLQEKSEFSVKNAKKNPLIYGYEGKDLGVCLVEQYYHLLTAPLTYQLLVLGAVLAPNIGSLL